MGDTKLLPNEVISTLNGWYDGDEWKLLHVWVTNNAWLLTCYSNFAIQFIRIYKGRTDGNFYLQLDDTVELP